jgi:hypothetical protein
VAPAFLTDRAQRLATAYLQPAALKENPSLEQIMARNRRAGLRADIAVMRGKADGDADTVNPDPKADVPVQFVLSFAQSAACAGAFRVCCTVTPACATIKRGTARR